MIFRASNPQKEYQTCCAYTSQINLVSHVCASVRDGLSVKHRDPCQLLGGHRHHRDAVRPISLGKQTHPNTSHEQVFISLCDHLSLGIAELTSILSLGYDFARVWFVFSSLMLAGSYICLVSFIANDFILDGL